MKRVSSSCDKSSHHSHLVHNFWLSLKKIFNFLAWKTPKLSQKSKLSIFQGRQNRPAICGLPHRKIMIHWIHRVLIHIILTLGSLQSANDHNIYVTQSGEQPEKVLRQLICAPPKPCLVTNSRRLLTEIANQITNNPQTFLLDQLNFYDRINYSELLNQRIRLNGIQWMLFMVPFYRVFAAKRGSILVGVRNMMISTNMIYRLPYSNKHLTLCLWKKIVRKQQRNRWQ